MLRKVPLKYGLCDNLPLVNRIVRQLKLAGSDEKILNLLARTPG